MALVTTRNSLLLLLLLLLLSCLTFCGVTRAGNPAGVGELRLDAQALGAIAERTLPRSILFVPIDGLEFSLQRGTLERPELSARGFSVTLPWTVDPGGWRGFVRVRFEPELHRSTGLLLFRVAEIRWRDGEPTAPMPRAEDLFRELPAWELPRSLRWSLPTPDGDAEAVAWLQGFEIDDERLTLKFGLGFERPKSQNPD